MHIRRHLRRIIFDRFNDTELRFNNDEILEAMIKGRVVAESATTDDIDDELRVLQDRGVVRDIAQNFTTVWFKLFDHMISKDCTRCGEIHIGLDEETNCPLCSTALR